MRSQEVKLTQYAGRWSFDYQNLLAQVAEARFGLKWENVETGARVIQACEVLQVDELEDVFVLRFVSIDLMRKTAVVFYEDNPGWCFQHQRYQSEVEHQGMHSVTGVDAHLEAAYEERYDSGD